MLQLLMENQDEELEMVGKSVRQLKQIGVAIGDELDDQAV